MKNVVIYTLQNANGTWTSSSFETPSRAAAQAWVNQMRAAYGNKFVATVY